MADNKTNEVVRKCENCGKPIPKIRIKAIPNVSMCVGCQSKYESEFGSESTVALDGYDASELFDAISNDDND